MFAAFTLIGWISILGTPAIPPATASSAATLKTSDRLSLTLSPRVTMAGRNVRTIVRVDRNAANRWLRIAVDGPFYGASTERQLDGEEAERTFEMMWQSLPAGEYMVTVEVEGAKGVRHREQRVLMVSGIPDDPSGSRPVGMGSRASNP